MKKHNWGNKQRVKTREQERTRERDEAKEREGGKTTHTEPQRVYACVKQKQPVATESRREDSDRQTRREKSEQEGERVRGKGGQAKAERMRWG